jgi:hypothetical protein
MVTNSGRSRTETVLGAIYTYTISHANPRTICCQSDGDPNLCTIRIQSVYTQYESPYESPNDLVQLSSMKAKIMFPEILNCVQFGAFQPI